MKWLDHLFGLAPKERAAEKAPIWPYTTPPGTLRKDCDCGRKQGQGMCDYCGFFEP
jgi:hypothetical protein